MCERYWIRQTYRNVATILRLVCREGKRNGEGSRRCLQVRRVGSKRTYTDVNLPLFYRNYLSMVTFYQKVCDEFLEDLNTTSGLFTDLIKDYGFVENQTRSLQTTCEELLQEQVRKEKRNTRISSDGLSLSLF